MQMWLQRDGGEFFLNQKHSTDADYSRVKKTWENNSDACVCVDCCFC